jgi:threonyl-tRNA synthetase
MADPAPAVVPDGAYLEAVTQKRIRIFEELQARQALERLNIGGEPIK